MFLDLESDLTGFNRIKPKSRTGGIHVHTDIWFDGQSEIVLLRNWNTLHHIDKFIIINNPIVVLVTITHQFVNFPILKNKMSPKYVTKTCDDVIPQRFRQQFQEQPSIHPNQFLSQVWCRKVWKHQRVLFLDVLESFLLVRLPIAWPSSIFNHFIKE